MVNMWYFHQKIFLDAEDPVLLILINFLFWQQKIGRSSVAKDLDAEDSVLFLLMKFTFWEQKICQFQFPQAFINRK